VREFTLSASCPEAARILLSQKDPMQFYEVETDALEEEFEDYDPLVYEKLLEARGEMLKLLQNRDIPVKERAAALWDFIQIFQEEMDEGTLFSDSTIYEKLIPRNPKTSFEEAKALFALLHNLELLADDWEETLEETERLLYCKGAKEYETVKVEFSGWRRTGFPDWDVLAEQLLVYFITTYFCGAVYDEYVASKVKMSVCSVFFLEELATAQWVKNNGKLSMQEFTGLVYRYSRELEHSDENLITMDQMMEEI
jgi:lysine-N-methylase